MALHIPHWGRGSRNEQRHPGHWGTDLWANKGQSQTERWPPRARPLPDAASPGGVGKLMPFMMNRSRSLLLRSGKILPGRQAGQAGRQRHLSPAACSPSFPAAEPGNEPHAGFRGCLSSWVTVSQSEFSVQFHQWLTFGPSLQSASIYLVPTLCQPVSSLLGMHRYMRQTLTLCSWSPSWLGEQMTGECITSKIKQLHRELKEGRDAMCSGGAASDRVARGRLSGAQGR